MRKLCFLLVFIMISSPLFARSEKISFWHGQGFHAKRIIEELVDEYNRTHSDVHVDAVFQGLYQDMEVKMLAAAVTRQLPEVALEQIEYIDLYVNEGLVSPIDAVIKEETRKDVWGVMWDAVTREGRTYGVPFCMSTTVLFYNRDVFEKSGLDPDKPPETWEQIIAFGRRLSVDENGDGSPDRFAISVWQNGLYGWAPILWANGGTLFSEDGTRINLTSSEMKKTIGMLKDLVYKHEIMPKSWTDWESGQAFLAGDLAMGFFSSAGIAYSEQNLPWSLGVAPMPSINGRRFTVLSGSALVNFAKNKKKKKAANDFIFWLIDKPNIIRLHKEIGYIPVRKSAVNSLDLRSFHRTNPNFRIPVEQLAFARSLPHHNEYFKINKLLIEMLQRVILQDSNPDETLAATEKEINLLLE
jgi:sn-glycerol 3-phosphate transport system substrate-binding protein